MKLMDSKKYLLGGALTFALFGILMGWLLILLPASVLLRIVFVIMGIVTVVTNVPTLVAGLVNGQSTEGKLCALLSLISIVVGFLMIFWHSGILMLLLGAYMIVTPLFEVLTAKRRGERFKAELPKMILGLVMILVGPARTLGALFDIAGWIIIALSVIYVVGMLIGTRKKQNVTGSRVFADTDGDGKIDTVYVDTTGDGNADTATRYNDSL